MKKSIVEMEVTAYDINGKLQSHSLSRRYLNSKSNIIDNKSYIEKDGYAIVSISNLSKKEIGISELNIYAEGGTIFKATQTDPYNETVNLEEIVVRAPRLTDDGNYCGCTTDPHPHQYDPGHTGGGGSGGSTSSGGGDNPASSEEGADDTELRKIRIVNGQCAALKLMLQLQAGFDREIVGIYTTDGKVFILPSIENNPVTSYTSNQYTDESNRTVFSMGQSSNGTWEITTYDYSKNPVEYRTHTVAGHYHTHPNGVNQDIASDNDKAFATNAYLGMPKYILNSSNIVHYTSYGEGNKQNLHSV
ncbi:hypothetical protein BWI97_17100, partial [Siphonobacter sp. BAB-5405]